MTTGMNGRLSTGAWPIVMIAALAVSGCDENGKFSFGKPADSATTGAAGDAAGQSVQLVERDVEAPNVFQSTESGLWDGRPSLGGVWVAHPDVTDPERVIIRNQDNGKFVIGALFRRERDNPGPALQVSSDAADALGMLAGAPANLNVTALRREEVPQAAPPEATTDFSATSDVSATPLDPIAGAAAAIDAAETSPGPTMAPAAISQTSLDPAPGTPAATPAPAPAPAAPRAAASSLSKPFIQIGIFSVEANANRTADQMRAAGLIPTVTTQQAQGKPFYRVIVGPATSEAERAQLLAKVKGLGFADAYFVTN